MSVRFRKGAVLLIMASLLMAGLLAVPSLGISASPDQGGRVPYIYHLEQLHTSSASGDKIAVLREMQLDIGKSLEMTGWVATAEGISTYQYLWLPVGGGGADWQTVTDLRIEPRNDLAAAGVAHPSGHSTAGVTLSILPPKDLVEGYYDVYIRALDGMGIPCDLAAILNLRYGSPDEISESSHTISFPRILREGVTALFGGASVSEDAIILPPDGGVRLGTLNLAGFEAIRIKYEVTDPEAAGKTPVLGLKSAGVYSYGKGNESYNVTHSIAYTAVPTDGKEIRLDLTGCDDLCEVWLTGHLNADLRITNIEFICNGYTTSRVAARIHFSEDLITGYFRGNNRTDLKAITDPVLGDVLRMEVREETNDPYVQFDAGELLKDHGILLDADEYKYMVFLYRAATTNNSTRMNLYLCSGSITNATEACNQGVGLIADGKWHYLMVDLTQRENWGGVINGWRFDYISANSDPGDGVDFASVQFFRTAEAALAAASQDPARATPFTVGDTPVVPDMSEEEMLGADDGNQIVIDPSDTYEVTEPATEPPVEPSTDPIDETTSPLPQTSEDATTASPTETTPTGKGCRSSLVVFSVLPVISIPAFILRKRKKSMQ